MQAFILEKYGRPLRSVTLPEPTAAPHEVLVRMIASGVNHVDDRTRTGQFKAVFPMHLPKVLGQELAGEVIAVGSQVTGTQVGDTVYGYTGITASGTFSEVVAVDATALSPAPSSVSPVEAAALPLAALTAWRSLVGIGNLQAGQTVLIHGGTGSVGSIAIQLAKHLGASVVTTASAGNASLARDLGADLVIDYRTQDFVEQLSSTPVDIVLDTQGGEVTSRSLEVLRPGGVVVGISGTPDPSFAEEAGAPWPVKALLTMMSYRLRRKARRLGVTYRFLFAQPDGARLREVSQLVDQGALRPVVDRVLPLEQTDKALQQVLAGGTRGKVLVMTDPVEVTARS